MIAAHLELIINKSFAVERSKTFERYIEFMQQACYSVCFEQEGYWGEAQQVLKQMAVYMRRGLYLGELGINSTYTIIYYETSLIFFRRGWENHTGDIINCFQETWYRCKIRLYDLDVMVVFQSKLNWNIS